MWVTRILFCITRSILLPVYWWFYPILILLIWSFLIKGNIIKLLLVSCLNFKLASVATLCTLYHLDESMYSNSFVLMWREHCVAHCPGSSPKSHEGASWISLIADYNPIACLPWKACCTYTRVKFNCIISRGEGRIWRRHRTASSDFMLEVYILKPITVSMLQLCFSLYTLCVCLVGGRVTFVYIVACTTTTNTIIMSLDISFLFQCSSQNSAILFF